MTYKIDHITSSILSIIVIIVKEHTNGSVLIIIIHGLLNLPLPQL